MIEIPRAAVTADEIAEEADFFSFGTNDLTQMTFGFSRDDVKFLPDYVDQEILPDDPFQSPRPDGRGQLVRWASRRAAKRSPGSRSASAASTAATRRRSTSATGGPRLRLLLAVPRADRPPRGGAGRERAEDVKVSAGVLLYRFDGERLQLLIAHPGGPYFTRRNVGAWTIPKGMVEDGESLEAAARREFEEETGFRCPKVLVPLRPVRLRSGKRVHAFAGEGDVNPSSLASNDFEMEWPKGSGRTQRFPEIDRVRFVSPEEARTLLNPAQCGFVDALQAHLAGRDAGGAP
jgi:predicted NUDIX family NTP pyrophosphohydrolase